MSVNLQENGQCVHFTISPSGGSKIVPQTEQNGQDMTDSQKEMIEGFKSLDEFGWLIIGWRP